MARAKPGQLTFGHSGIGTSLHLAGELFKAMAHVDIQQVPFRGSTLVITDVIGGRMTMSFIPPTGTLSIIQENKVRALAVTSLKRVPFLPDVPTMEESGFPGFDVTTWWGMVVPVGTPAAIIDRLNRVTVKVMATPEMREQARRHRPRADRRHPGGVRRRHPRRGALLGAADQRGRRQADRLSGVTVLPHPVFGRARGGVFLPRSTH